MVTQNKKIGMEGIVPPPVDSSLEGAPAPAVIYPEGGARLKTSASETSETSETSAQDIPYMSGYGDIIPYLEKKVKEYKPLTEEEQKKLRRRQRAEGIIGGISDAVRAVANLFYTTQYAPNMYNAGEGMSARAKARFDKEAADRKARDDEYFNYAMTLGKMKHGAAQEEREWRHTLEREKITDKWRQDAEDRKNAKEEFDAQKRMLDLKYQQGKIDRQSYLTKQEELETEYMKTHHQKMPTTPKPSSGGGTGRGRGTGNQKTSLWKAYNPKTGETIQISASSEANAWSQVPAGFTIRQSPTTTVTDGTSGSGFKTKKTHSVTVRNANDNLYGPKGKTKWTNASKIKY